MSKERQTIKVTPADRAAVLRKAARSSRVRVVAPPALRPAAAQGTRTAK